MSDWSSVRRPPAHRVDNKAGSACNTVSRVIVGLAVVLVACFMALLTALPNDRDCPPGAAHFPIYNSTYPLSPATKTKDGLRYRVAVITDLDLDSKSETEKNTWYSYMRQGYFTINSDLTKVSIEWDKTPIELKSSLSQGGRSMELSELKVFDGRLLSVDDRTGIVYEIINNKVVPWVILIDGDGTESKGLKGEWMTVKNDLLIVGGLGKEWTTIMGEFRNHNPMWTKQVTHTGFVRHLDWVEIYKRIRAAAGIQWPGYMIHESAQWSDIHGRWFFLPRRASKESYTEADDETRGTNYMLICDENFENIQVKHVTPLKVQRGFSAFQFVPGTQDRLIVALKSEEDKGTINSYITVFDIDGQVIYEEQQLEGHYKYEGFEFI